MLQGAHTPLLGILAPRGDRTLQSKALPGSAFPRASRSLAFLAHSKLEFSCFIKIFCTHVMYSHVYGCVYVHLCVCSPEANVVPQELSISFLETDFLTDLEFADSFRLAGQQVLGSTCLPFSAIRVQSTGFLMWILRLN